MPLPSEAVSLKIFIGEAARSGHQALYEAIVLKARELGLAGATVLRGPMGYGSTTHLRTAKILQLSDDLPLVIDLEVGEPVLVNHPFFVSLWVLGIALLMVSRIPTLALTSFRIGQRFRIPLLAVIGVAASVAVDTPWMSAIVRAWRAWIKT